MQITIKDGYIENFAVVGNLVGGIVVDDVPEEELARLEECCSAYKVEGRRVVFDEARYKKLSEVTPIPTQLDRIEAQVTYTAMITDTLLEV